MTSQMQSRGPAAKDLGGTRIVRRPRRGLWYFAIGAGVLAATIAVLLLVVYPRIGARKIREKLTAKVEQKLGRSTTVGAIEVSLGHAVLRNVEIRGPHDGELPLVHIDQIDVDFDAMSSLVGSVELGEAKIDGVIITIRRHADGSDNIRDVIEHLQSKDEGAEPSGGKTMPTSIKVTHTRLLADDAQAGATLIVNDGEASWKPGDLVALARNVTATTISAPKASASKLEVIKLAGKAPIVTVEGGELSLWPRLSLTGIGGKVMSNPAKPGEYTIDLAGGYGNVPGNLWTAKGGFDSRALVASIDLEAEKFQLDRLAPILARTPVVDYNSTSVDTKIHLDVERNGGKFAGEFHLRGLNVGHPMIADKEVHDLDLSGKIAGSFDRTKRQFTLDRGDFIARDVPFSVTGTVARPRLPAAVLEHAQPDMNATADVLPTHGPAGIQVLDMRVVILPIDCQRVLNAIPTEMAPYMAGYKLTGVFDADVTMNVDWADLDATKLDGHIGLRKCKVLEQPADSPKRLKTEFDHYVEVDQGKWTSFVVGPTNEDFVPFEEISPYLVKSIMSTEDSGFYFHHGFITSEFRTALINDLKAGAFKYGASSITMQMVKNVLLYREKTLARKLQELFLTWHVENTLSKDRILEIYFNVIEYGPGLYGIGPASMHFFGKKPKDLNPVEAAFFSTILPAPKERYKQYCAGTLTKWTRDKIDRILNIELKRDRLTQTEFDQALATPLLFVKDWEETEDECLKRVRQAIKNARSTNPNAKTSSQEPKKKDPPKKDPPKKKKKP